MAHDIEIPNFCGGAPLRTTTINFSYETLVAVCQQIGSMSFQHAMTADQADLLAEALRAKATEARAAIAKATGGAS